MKKVFTKKGFAAIVILTALCSVETVAFYQQSSVVNYKKSLVEKISDDSEIIKIASVDANSDSKVEVKKSKSEDNKIEDKTESSGEFEGDDSEGDVGEPENEVTNGLIDLIEDSEKDSDINVVHPGGAPDSTEGETVEGETGEGETGEGETGEGETTEEETREPVVETDPAYEVVADYYKVKKDNRQLVGLYVDREDSTFTKIEIPAGVKSIADNAFEGYKYVTEVTFAQGASVTSIGKFAFYNCSAITDVTLPDTITTINENAFNNCQAMVNIKLPSKLQKIGKSAFEKCFSINELIIPVKVKTATEIMGYQGCANKVVFEEGRFYIPAGIFRNAQGIKAVAMYKGVNQIKKQAFMGCSSLKKITSPTTLKKINKEAFKGCTVLSKYSIKPSLYYIGHEAFRDCESLESLVLNKTVTVIGKDAFAGDINLIVKVVANSMQKRYAIKNNIKWTYTDAEQLRRNLSFEAKAKLEKIVKNTADQYSLKKLNDYVPQGVCRAGNYTLISAYKSGGGKSIILVYDKNGKYIKYVYVPHWDHVGSLCNIKGKVALSLNNISTNDYIAIISNKKIKSTKNGHTLKYDYKVKLSGHADYTAFDGTYLWAGHSFDKAKCTLNVYKVKTKKVKVSGKKKKEKRLTFTKRYTYSTPGNIQGIVVNKKGLNKREVILSQSYGVIPDSHVYVHRINLLKDRSLGSASDIYRVPAMLEGIEKKGKYMYLLFESASGKYTKDDTHQTEIQIDKLYKIKFDDLDKLYKDE